MAPQLPPELWALITQYLHHDTASIARCARVCRQWQPVFEKLLYHNIRVESEHVKKEKGVMSLSQLCATMSPANKNRRSFVRRLEYRIIIPHKLKGYRTIKTKNQEYCEENPVREENNRAFAAGICALFEILSSWDQTNTGKFALALRVDGRLDTVEPGTKEDADLDRWQTVFDAERWLPRPYSPRFPEGEVSLRHVCCVEELHFEVWY